MIRALVQQIDPRSGLIPMSRSSLPIVNPAGSNGYLTLQRVGEGKAARERAWAPTHIRLAQRNARSNTPPPTDDLKKGSGMTFTFMVFYLALPRDTVDFSCKPLIFLFPGVRYCISPPIKALPRQIPVSIDNSLSFCLSTFDLAWGV